MDVGMSATVMVVRLAAIKAVKRDMQAQGLRPAHVEQQVIVSAAATYLREHPELLEQAAETVQRNLELQTLAEREERRRNAVRCASLERFAQNSER
jgi:hypothetical protein